jgi:hypothetical protein
MLEYKFLVVHIVCTVCFILFLAYFPKIKVGLSIHQSVCLSVCVSPTNNV